MSRVLVPIRYPPSDHSIRTLREALRIADERDAELIILHVDLYQNGETVTRRDVKRAIQRAIGRIDNARISVIRGFRVEESILEQIIVEEVDLAVIGYKQATRWRRAFDRLIDDPDIASYLEDRVDIELVVVPPE